MLSILNLFIKLWRDVDMNTRPEIFLVTTVFLVPFLYFSSSVPDVCARPAPGIDTICLGDYLSEKGEKCCWKVTGETTSHFVCHTCWKTFNDQGSIERCSVATPAAFNNPLPGSNQNSSR